MSQSPKILIYCANLIPSESAATNYIVNFARILREAQFDVLFISDVLPSASQADASGKYWFRSFEYIPLGKPHYFRKPFAALTYFKVASRALSWLKGLPDTTGIAGLITFGGQSGVLMGLFTWAKRQHIKTMAISAEHHIPRSLIKRAGLFGWLDHELRIRWVNTRCDIVTVLSHYSQRFYQEKNCPVLLVRPMIDTREPMWQPVWKEPARPIRLLFIGSPRRDRQDLILAGLKQAHGLGDQVHLTYAGIGEDAFRQFLGPKSGLVDELGPALDFHPWVSWDDVPGLIGQADYCILFREDLRDMRYGFPSKTVEILAKGTPILCNKTSDMFEFIQDGRNGFQLDSLTADSLAQVLLRASRLSRDEYLKLRRAARQTAETSFDLRIYVGPLREQFGLPPLA